MGDGKGRLWVGHAPKRKSARSSVLWAFKSGHFKEVPGEDFNRTFISFPGVSFQGHGLH